jgi:hypothetical protein
MVGYSEIDTSLQRQAGSEFNLTYYKVQGAPSMRLDHFWRSNLRRGRCVQMAVVCDLFEVDVGMEKERGAHVA